MYNPHGRRGTKRRATTFDLIKKTMLMGVGLALMSKEKAEAMAREIADTAKIDELGQQVASHSH